MLAGCGGTLTAPTNATQIVRGARIALAVPSHELKQCGWLSGKEQASRRLIYVSNGDEVLIFPERPHNPAPIGCIVTPVNSAHGLYVDRHGNLYVANGNNTVTVYPPGSLTASATYSTGTAGPMYPIADHKGNVFVSTGNGRVIEFLRGQSQPYRTLFTPGYEADGMALDSDGNLYVTYRTAYLDGGIEKFAPGSTQGQTLGMQVIQPQGILVTSDGTIVVVETGRADGVYVFAQGSQTPKLKLTVGDTPVQLAITKPEHKLFVSSFGGLGSGRIYVAPYPLNASSHFHVKIVFRLRRGGHRRRDRWQIQGMAISNGPPF